MWRILHPAHHDLRGVVKMKIASLLSVFELVAAHVHQSFAVLWGDGIGPSRSWAILGWSAGWSGMMLSCGFWGLLIAGLVMVIRRLVLVCNARMASTKHPRAVQLLK